MQILLQLCSNSKDHLQTETRVNNCITEKQCVESNQNSARDEENGSENAPKKQKTIDEKHVVIINVSPLEYCNVLLVPNIQGGLSQVSISLH